MTKLWIYEKLLEISPSIQYIQQQRRNRKYKTNVTNSNSRNSFAASDVADVEDDVKALYKTGNYHLIQCNYTPMHRHF